MDLRMDELLMPNELILLIEIGALLSLPVLVLLLIRAHCSGLRADSSRLEPYSEPSQAALLARTQNEPSRAEPAQ